ncbi:carboxylesterase family protein-like protein [Mollisia scopiformis]|uniref:Carboxylic ester hydrolase n=1 Tax=Mollisia scopiformis TaxID=149040 RepID=A0A132B9V7_MOLSC|nr:carboxylesterase family protein-like protein [Mollisia scopiformis]KUJ08779.1 carboxylesterase family protein-like protein [Mollisia scopiformis]
MSFKSFMCKLVLAFNINVVVYATTINSSAPIVDLGYAVHKAVVNTTGAYYNFSNIRYAEPPVGQFRFRAAIPPTTINRTVQEAPPDQICYQGGASAWQALTGPFLASIIAGPNASLAGGIDHSAAANISIPAGIPTTGTPIQSEDCLFLDVMAPEVIFNAANTSAKGAPVMLMIHGGGFTGGWKDGVGNPAGLLAEGMRDGRTGFVYVQINYRLGFFGFPPKSINDKDTQSNAGLLDQRLAITWVQNYIHLFGGNPNDITLMGESAGASSIMAHITSYGGNGTVPFQQALMQSPAWRPASTAAFYQDLYQEVLQLANATSYAQIRTMNSSQLEDINNAIVAVAPYASFSFGTNIDGDYIPDAPTVLLAQGKFHKNLTIMVTHNSNEGLLFTDPTVNSQSAFIANLHGLAIGASNASINHLATVTYPPVFDGSQPYTTETERTSIAMREGIVECNAFALNKAFNNNTRAYTFGEFPGLHAQDLEYIFWNGDSVGTFGDPINSTAVKIIQSATVQFVLTGNPNVPDYMGAALPELPLYGEGAEILFLNGTTVQDGRDSAANQRCDYWETGLYED